MKKLFHVVIICWLATDSLLAQLAERSIKVIVAPDHTDWLYRPGEAVKFTITVLRNGNLLKGAKLRYEIGPEKMEPVKKETITLSTGTMTVDGGTMTLPGFLRCIAFAEVEGNEYKNLATVGFDPQQLTPVVEQPVDFQAFWNNAKAELAKIPLDARMTLLPDRCTEKVNVYHLTSQNYGNSRLYGILCVPKAEGKYPALLRVPGAGIRPYQGDVANAEKGIITLEIGIHGIPVTMAPDVYVSLSAGALQRYWNINLEDRDWYYYKRVYLGCIRANDVLTSLPQYDGQHLAVMGGSQGGALSIISAGLDSRVKWVGAYFPALCDLTGYLKGRAGGWPHLFTGKALEFNNKPEKIKTAAYYDVVNFARLVNVPGYYSWGFNDEICPPTSMYAAYNVIPASTTKILELYQDAGHWTYPEQAEKGMAWLLKQLIPSTKQ